MQDNLMVILGATQCFRVVIDAARHLFRMRGGSRVGVSTRKDGIRQIQFVDSERRRKTVSLRCPSEHLQLRWEDQGGE